MGIKMYTPYFIEKEDLKFFKKIVETQGLRRGYKLHCHLMAFISNWQNRKHLREQLVQTIEQQYKKKLPSEQKKTLLTPGVPPQLPFASVSVSHCAFLGGFVISPSGSLNTPSSSLKLAFVKQPFIGFDLEQLGRAKEKTLLRISNKKELSDTPSPSALWSAKEAAYKSISSLQRDTHIKHISIFGWQPVSSIENIKAAKPNISKKLEREEKESPKIYDYQFIIKEKNIKGEGFVCCLNNVVIGLAFSKSRR
ncbi:MAG: 4'-phosphopantetheinyl transferase superfamily protein [Oligoflexia bacterium]|nr:4'-phosphopantetheinyl transferase superfamily protein [Oligoflexia bacterium]